MSGQNNSSSIDDEKSVDGGESLSGKSIPCDSSSAETIIYSNKCSLSPPQESRNKNEKGVSFSIERSHGKRGKYNDSNTYSVQELVLKSKEELAELVCSLQQRNAKLKVDYAEEKKMRKKRADNMVKLAKRMNILNDEMSKQQSLIQQMRSTEAEHDKTLIQYKLELETAHEKSTNASRDHHKEINDLQTKNRELQTEFHETVAEISSKNQRQVEDLRRQVLLSQLEVDRLRIELAGLKMEAQGESTIHMDRVIEKTLRDHDNYKHDIMNENKIFSCLSSIKFWRVVGFFFGAVLIPSIAIAHKMDLLSQNSVCAPVMPGTHLHSNFKGDLIFEAPWWMFPLLKKSSFDWFCAKRRRTRIEWLQTGKLDQSKLVVIDLNKVSETKSGKVTNGQVFERKATSITLHSDAISYENNKGGKQERRKAPWVPSRKLLRK